MSEVGQFRRANSQAVLLFNRTASKATMRIEWENLGIYAAAGVRDLWLRRDLGVLTREYVADVPAHGVVMLRVVPHYQKLELSGIGEDERPL